MPTYDYRCTACRKIFSVTRSWADFDTKRTPKCPRCGKRKAVEQLFASVLVKTSKKS